MPSSTTQTKIANSALSKIGVSSINDISDNTSVANDVRSVYDIALESALRAHTWNFALRRTKLYPQTETPPFGYAYQYILPNDFIRVSSIEEGLEYSIEGQLLLTDYATISLVYVSKVTQTGLFDPIFVSAFTFKLASELAYKQSGSSTRGSVLAEEFREIVKEARLVDSQESPVRTLGHNDWLDEYH